MRDTLLEATVNAWRASRAEVAAQPTSLTAKAKAFAAQVGSREFPERVQQSWHGAPPQGLAETLDKISRW